MARLGNRERPPPPRRLPKLEAACLAALVLVYLVTVLPNIGNDPIVGGDEGWIISASARLAQHGVFGSGLFRGFYGAEDHYYFNLPLYHLILAAWFKLAGVGVVQARLVSVAFGLVALLLTWALGRRIGGAAVGVAAAALLTLLRLNLAPFSGLTLTDLGATVRYDLATLPFGLAAALLLLRRPQAPTALQAALAGLLVGLAALTQFIGAMFALPLAVFLLTTSQEWPRRLLLTGLFVLMLALPFVPYAAYIAADRTDFSGQSRSVEQRTDFLSPGFYADQLRHEPDRFAEATSLRHLPSSAGDLVARPSARLALLLVAPLAGIYVLLRGRREPAYRLLALLLWGTTLQLALFESTKRFEYWVIVVPFLCIAAADLAAWLWRGGWRRQPGEPLFGLKALQPSGPAGPEAGRASPLLARVVVALVLALFAVEGLAVAGRDVRDARHAEDYAALGRRLDAALPPGSSALGDNRLWPALRDRDFRSLLLVFYHTNPKISRGRTTDVFGALDRTQADYILLSPLSRDILKQLTPRDAADFARYLDTRTDKVATVPDRTYGPIDVYRVRP